MRISDWSSDVCSSDLQGIEIDYCPQCRGVWLDRGELDKIIERSDAASAPAPRASTPPPPPQPEYRERGYDDRHYGKPRSDEHSVGKECVRTSTSRWSPAQLKQKTITEHQQ